MRGAVSGGMALALGELGFADAFDAAYGASAGTLNALWLISGRVREGIPTWVDPHWNRELISRARVLRGRPMVDVQGLVEQRYEQLSPGLFAAALACGTELHPLATSVESGEAVDLFGRVTDPVSLRAAVQASATLPLIAGPPVAVGSEHFLDAGLTAAIPLQAAVNDGATHILVLRSRLEGETTLAPSGLGARLTARALRRVDPAVARAFLTRAERELVIEDQLARHAADPSLTPHILSIRPGPGSPVPSRLDRDLKLVAAALEAGRVAAHKALGGAAAPRAEAAAGGG